jgi:endonuclease YncB( thermonuclease family)
LKQLKQTPVITSEKRFSRCLKIPEIKNKIMLKKSLFVIVTLTLLSLQTVFSQGLINGTVVDVIDGRTLVIANSTGKKINVRLRYLEIPEAEQPLAEVVKNHLRDLALGKKLYVTKVQVFSNYALGVGVVTERDVKIDLSQQMIRDGAGWFDIYDASASTDESAADYQETESLAKSEKRGVWAVAGMKTAWDYRNEKAAGRVTPAPVSQPNKVEKKATDLSLAELVQNSSNNSTINGLGRLAIYDFEYKTVKPATDATGNTGESKPATGTSNNPTNDLTQVYFANVNKGAISTKPLEFTIQNGKVTQKLALVFVYNYSMENSKKNVDKIGLAVFADLYEKAFLQGKSVSLILDDGNKVNLGVGKYIGGKRADGIIYENIDRSEILSVLASNSVTLIIGKNKKKIPDSYKQTINNFVNTLK